jgi:hypothetical protein
MNVSVLENCEGSQPKNCISVQAKCRVWHQKIFVCFLECVEDGSQKMASLCRRSVKGGTEKKGVRVLVKYTGCQPKIAASLQAKCGGWHPKMESVSSGSVQGYSQKLALVCSRSVEGEYKNIRQCARELSIVAAKQ